MFESHVYVPAFDTYLVVWRHLGASSMQQSRTDELEPNVPQCGSERCMIFVEDHCHLDEDAWAVSNFNLTKQVSKHIGTCAGRASEGYLYQGLLIKFGALMGTAP